jgi:hypothetical protein
MSPGKVYTPSIMSTLQSYRQSSDYNNSKHDDNNDNELNHHTATTTSSDINRPW